jgi:hypothetical protein
MNVDDRYRYRQTGHQSLIRGAGLAAAERNVG